MTTLTTVAARTASTIRGIALGYIAIQVVIWHSFYAADPWRLAGPVVAAACAAAVVGYLRWRPPGWRPPGWQLAVADSAVQVALALGAASCVPPAMRGDTANWLYIGMVSQLVVPAWFAPGRVFVPLALVSGTAYWAGAVMSPAAAAADNSPAAAAAFLFAVAAVAWCGLRMVYSRAAAADLSLASADRDSRAQYVALSRNTERREHERLLHDTVLNTLTALGRRVGSRAAEVVARARHDVTLMERVLTPMLNQAGDLESPAGEPDGGLLVGLEAVATHMRARGLIVHVGVTRRAPTGDGGAAEGGAPLGDEHVPAQVAWAITHAAGEALANVAAHAGTGEAWVAVDLTAPEAAGSAQPGRLQVSVRDNGAGFDPARIDPARLGLRRSIVERAADWGAQASVRSAPGEGTVVSLGWTAPADTASRGRGGVASRGDAYDFDLSRMAGTVAAIWQVTLLIQVLAYLHNYRQPAVVIAVWVGLLAAAVWLVPRARAGGLSVAEAVAAVVIAVAAVAMVGWERRAHGAAGTVDWSVAGTGWLLALVALSCPAWLWVSGAILVFAAHAVVAIPLLGTASLGLARLAATAYTLVVVLAVFGAMRPAVRTQAAMAARRAALMSRAAAENAAADAVRADRRERLALLESEALPLLRGIAGGTLDAAGRDVRERCARYAATLRRVLADRAPAAGGLLSELEPALRSAAARGLLTEVQVIGDPGRPGREVADATLAAVDGVMRALPPHPVTLTVLAAGDDVELYVAFVQPPRDAPEITELAMTELTAAVPAAARWSATVDVEDSGAGCLEVRWRKLVAA
jgi:signal transduction histidine kinase